MQKESRVQEERKSMEVVQVLHMNGGVGETSYANNSLVQKEVISKTKSIREEAILDLCSTTMPKNITVADLGCSSGPNTLLAVSQLMEIVYRKSCEMGHQAPDFLVFLNDLPGNDFNNIFMSLPTFYEQQRSNKGDGFGHCFIAGVPGSFYGRLFAGNSLHFVHASCSLHWLSQVPQGLDSNKGNICTNKTSPACVIKAYQEQFQTDFSMFLRFRSDELVDGGRMVLTMLGRTSEDFAMKESIYIYELLGMALDDLASKGLIERENFHTFNIPLYTPSPMELKYLVQKEGSFVIDRLEVFEVDWNVCNIDVGDGDRNKLKNKDSINGYNVATCIRAVAEPLLVSHFGEGIMDALFSRYKEIVADCMSKRRLHL